MENIITNKNKIPKSKVNSLRSSSNSVEKTKLLSSLEEKKNNISINNDTDNNTINNNKSINNTSNSIKRINESHSLMDFSIPNTHNYAINSFNSTSINTDSEILSSFNIESLITIDEAICYFFSPNIKPIPNSFIDFYKTIRYFMFNIVIKKIFRSQIANKKVSNQYYLIIKNFLNLQFLSILLEGLYLKINNNRINNVAYNIIKNCISCNYQNFLLLCKILVTELNKNNFTNIYLNKISNTILKKSIIRTGFRTKDIFTKIEKRNKEIFSQLKSILNINKSLNKTKPNLSSFSSVLKIYEKLSTNWVIDYCLKTLGVPENQLKEIKEATYLDLEEGEGTPLYLPIKFPFMQQILGIGSTLSLNNTSSRLTVVLDLDETLIRFNMNPIQTKGYLIKRPNLDIFLSSLIKENCELIVFTVSTQEYAEPIMDEIENGKKYFSKRLFRQHSVLIGSAYIKDISKLGRDLKKTIIVDNDSTCFYLQQRNGIAIKPFFGDENDNVLGNLFMIIKKIISQPFEDIRKELEKLKEEIDSTVSK